MLATAIIASDITGTGAVGCHVTVLEAEVADTFLLHKKALFFIIFLQKFAAGVQRVHAIVAGKATVCSRLWTCLLTFGFLSRFLPTRLVCWSLFSQERWPIVVFGFGRGRSRHVNLGCCDLLPALPICGISRVGLCGRSRGGCVIL